MQSHNHKRPIIGQYLAQQTSFSSSEEDDGKLMFNELINLLAFYFSLKLAHIYIGNNIECRNLQKQKQ